MYQREKVPDAPAEEDIKKIFLAEVVQRWSMSRLCSNQFDTRNERVKVW